MERVSKTSKTIERSLDKVDELPSSQDRFLISEDQKNP